jgi:beta-lactamase regulating signal transducer with metallopeptidase domain
MNILILNLNPLAADWQAVIWRACWQGGLALLLVWAVCRVFHRLPARAKSWLWRLAYMKLLVAFLWAAPIALPLLPARMPLPAPEAQRPVSTASLEIPSPAVSFADQTAPAAPVSSASTRVVASQIHSAPAIDFRPNAACWLLLIWSLGVGAFGICVWRDLRRARLLLRGCVPVVNAPLLECSAELARSMGLRGVPSLMMTDAVSSPLLLAGSWPVIVLPTALASGSTLEHLRLMIAHEMAHMKRFDLWWVWLAVAGEGLFFFHPILWLARREWRLTQEMACDEMALRITRVPASTYGDMLVGVAALKLSSRLEPIWVTLGLTETKEMLARRLNAMKLIKSRSTKVMALATVAILVFSAACVPPWRLVQPSPPAGAASPSANSGPRPGAGMRTPEYEVDGRIELRLSRPDRSLLKDYQGSFRVYVKGCAWLIQVTEMNDWDIPQRREVGTSDGKEMFEIVVPYEPISPSDPVVFIEKAMPPGVHIEPEGTVASSAIPVGEQDNSFTGHLWLMFASGFYLRTAVSGGQLTPMFDWRATPYMNNHASKKAAWKLINTPGSLPSKVTFFEDDGTTEAVYEATGFTNVGELTLPNGFHFTEPVTGYKEVSAVVTAVRPICSRADLRPVLKQKMDIMDMRWYDENNGSQWPGYDADHWPTVKEAKRIYSSTRHSSSRRKVPGATIKQLERIYASMSPAVTNAPSVSNGVAPTAGAGPDTPFASAIMNHPGVKLPEQGPWTVSSADFMQMAPFIVDLVNHKDPMFVFLWNTLSNETKSALERERAKMGIPGVPYKPGTAPQVLVTNLNNLIQGKLIYDEPSFAVLKPYLSGDTVKLLNQPAGADVSRLNRLLLEDAFPLDILRRPKILFDASSTNYIFVDFAPLVPLLSPDNKRAGNTVSLYGSDGKKKWTADLGPAIADEFEDFPYFRNPGIPASKGNTGLWDVSPRSGVILVRITANHFYSVDVRNGEVLGLPHT